MEFILKPWGHQFIFADVKGAIKNSFCFLHWAISFYGEL